MACTSARTEGERLSARTGDGEGQMFGEAEGI